MKKNIIVMAVTAATAFIISMTLPKILTEATQINDPDVKFQTLEEFLESGVRIEYDEQTAPIDDIP